MATNIQIQGFVKIECSTNSQKFTYLQCQRKQTHLSSDLNLVAYGGVFADHFIEGPGTYFSRICSGEMLVHPGTVIVPRVGTIMQLNHSRCSGPLMVLTSILVSATGPYATLRISTPFDGLSEEALKDTNRHILALKPYVDGFRQKSKSTLNKLQAAAKKAAIIEKLKSHMQKAADQKTEPKTDETEVAQETEPNVVASCEMVPTAADLESRY